MHAPTEDRVLEVALSKCFKCNLTQITQSTSAVQRGPVWIPNAINDGSVSVAIAHLLKRHFGDNICNQNYNT